MIIYSARRPDGVYTDDYVAIQSGLHEGYIGPCPCCNRVIVVKADNDPLTPEEKEKTK